MKKECLLIVEDDKDISKLLKYNLEKAGFYCAIAFSGEDALQILDREPLDLVVLDIMLPGMDGLEVCKWMRKSEKNARLPIIMLTAKGEEVDRIVGFELGADDYIVKPFSPRELILRIKAILKRKNEEILKEKDILVSGEIMIDISRHKVFARKKEIELTPMEFNLLVTLVKRSGRVQTREKLLNDVWDMAADVTTRTIDTHVKKLRKKLGKSGRLLETVRGVGYRFSES